MKFILGEKLGMSQLFDEKGSVVPVTLIIAGPCQVTQIKAKEPQKAPLKQESKKPRTRTSSVLGKDGYDAIQIGFKKLKTKKIKKSQKKKPFKYLREFKGDISQYKVGQEIDASVFKEGDMVSISGITKGKGFQGVVKRWGFAGQPATRGTKHEERTAGSTGSRFPQRVIKGKKMAGRMGGERITIKNLKVIKIEKENNLLTVGGAVPGRRGTLLEIRSRS